MFNFVYTQATPAAARMLITASRINGTYVSDDIKALAGIDRYDISSSPFTLNDTHRGVIQQCLDWNGRGMVIVREAHEQASLGCSVALARQAKRVLIIAASRNLPIWRDAIKQATGEELLSYTNASALGDHRWITATCKDIAGSKILSEATFDQVLIEDIGGIKSSGNINGMIKGLMRECPNTLILADPIRLSANYKPADLYQARSGVLNEIANILELLWARKLTEFIWNLDGSDRSYLPSRGYLSTNPVDLLPLMGVFTALER